MAVTSETLSWVRGFRVAEKYGVVDRFADETREFLVDPVSGLVHAALCSTVTAVEEVVLPLPEAVQFVSSSPLCARCVTVRQEWDWEPAGVYLLPVLEEVVTGSDAVADWFASETVALRHHLGLLAESPDLLHRVAGSPLADMWADVPTRFAEHRDVLRYQVFAEMAVRWAVPLMCAVDFSHEWLGDNMWEKASSSSRRANATEFELSADALVAELAAKEPSPSLVKLLLSDAALSAERQGACVSRLKLDAACAMVDDVYRSSTVWMLAERRRLADLAMLWPAASAGSLSVIVAPDAVSVVCSSMRQRSRCVPVAASLDEPPVGLLQTAVLLASELPAASGVSSDQWTDVVGTVSALI
jgi:hypothetical protein